MLDLIRIKKTHSEVTSSSLLKLPTHNCKSTTVCENTSNNFATSHLKFYKEKRTNYFYLPSNYQREFQYQAYLNTNDKISRKSKPLHSQTFSVKDFSNLISRIRYEIIFLHGSARCKDVSFPNQHKELRLIINNQFYFARRNFQVWIVQIIDLSCLDKFLCVSSNLAATLRSLHQSLMFKYFLPP